jgi:hypothetical protein
MTAPRGRPRKPRVGPLERGCVGPYQMVVPARHGRAVHVFLLSPFTMAACGDDGIEMLRTYADFLSCEFKRSVDNDWAPTLYSEEQLLRVAYVRTHSTRHVPEAKSTRFRNCESAVDSVAKQLSRFSRERGCHVHLLFASVQAVIIAESAYNPDPPYVVRHQNGEVQEQESTIILPDGDINGAQGARS